MSGNVETRILEMQLDNKDFENGVKTTIASLETLEKKLELNNSGDGFEKVSKAVNTMQFDKVEEGLDNITSKFSLLGNIGLQAIERISTRIVDLGEKMIRNLTIDPVMDGWAEFNTKTDAIQTILGGIRSKYEATFGDDWQTPALEATSEALNRLNDYADKTVYNFAQMTENVGKFTNQGVDLETTTDAIQGIANWAAAVGANPTQMSRAMYNISQALGTGSMRLLDWRSIENANMATPEVRNLFAKVALQQGKLTATTYTEAVNNFRDSLKSGWLDNNVMAEAFQIYSNVFTEEELAAKYGAETAAEFTKMADYAYKAATQVKTVSQMFGVIQESIGSGWANSFEILFGGFAEQKQFLSDILEIVTKVIDYTTNDRNTWLTNLSDFGALANLRETIKTIVTLFTDFYWILYDVFALLTNPFDQSNFNVDDGILSPRVWDERFEEMYNSWQGAVVTLENVRNFFDNFREWLYQTGESGRSPINNLTDTLLGVAGVLGIVGEAFNQFGLFVGNILALFEPLVSSILDLTGQVGMSIYNLFLNTAAEGTIKSFFDAIYAVVAPVIEVIVSALTDVVNFVHTLIGVDQAADSVSTLAGPVHTLTSFLQLLGMYGSIGINIVIAAVKGLISAFGGLLKSGIDKVVNVFNQIYSFAQKIGKGTAAVKEFFDSFGGNGLQNLWNSSSTLEKIRMLISTFFESGFGKDAAESILNWYDNTFVPNFSGVISWIETAWSSVTSFISSIPTKIETFVNQLSGAFDAFKSANVDESMTPLEQFKVRIDAFFGSLFDEETKNGIMNAYETYVEPALNAISMALDTAFGWIGHVIDGIASMSGLNLAEGTGVQDGIKAYLSAFLTGYDSDADVSGALQAVDSVFGFFDTVQGWIDENLGDDLENIRKFFAEDIPDTWSTIDEFVFGKKVYKNEVFGGDDRLVREGGILHDLKTWIDGDGAALLNEIITWFNETWNTIDEFVFGKKVYKNEVFGGDDHLVREGGIWLTITQLADWIATKGTELWQKISNFLWGTEEDQANGKGGFLATMSQKWSEFETFISPITTWISAKGQELFDYLGSHDFNQMWSDLNAWLFGYDQVSDAGTADHVDGILAPLMGILQPISDFFTTGAGKTAIDTITSIDLSDVWAAIRKFFVGEDVPVFNETGGIEDVEHIDGLFDRLMAFFERVIDFFDSPEWQGFLASIQQFWSTIGQPIVDAITNIGGSFFGSFANWDPKADLFTNLGMIGSNLFSSVKTEGLGLIGQWFPGVDSMDGLVSYFMNMLFGGGNPEEIVQEAATEAQDEVSKELDAAAKYIPSEFLTYDINEARASTDSQPTNAFSWLLSSSLAEDFNSSAASAASNAAASVDQSAGGIRGFIENLLNGDNLKWVLGIGGLAMLKSLNESLTGNTKKGFLEQLSLVIEGIGDIFSGLGILVASLTAAAVLAPDMNVATTAVSLIKGIFDELKSFLWTLLGIELIDMTAGKVEDFAGAKLTNTKYQSNASTIAENIGTLGTGLESLINAMSSIIDVALKFTAIDWIIQELNSNPIIQTLFGEIPTLEKQISKIAQVAQSLFTSILPSLVAVAGLSMISSGTTAALTKQGSESPNGSLGTAFMGVASIIEALCDGISILINTLSIAGLIGTDINQLETMMGSVTSLIQAITIGGGVFTILSSLADMIKKSEGLGGVSGVINTFFAGLQAVEWAVVITAIGGLLNFLIEIAGETFTKLAGDVATKAFYVINIVGDAVRVLNTLPSMNSEITGQALEDAIQVLTSTNDWTIAKTSAVYNAEAFRKVAQNIRDAVLLLHQAIPSAGTEDEYDRISTIFEKLSNAYMVLNSVGVMAETGEEFRIIDVVDFQAQTSYIEMLARNLSNAYLAFRSIKIGDEDDLFENVSAFIRGISSLFGDDTAMIAGLISTFYNDFSRAAPQVEQTLGIIDQIGMKSYSDYGFIGTGANTRLGQFADDLEEMVFQFERMVMAVSKEDGSIDSWGLSRITDFFKTIDTVQSNVRLIEGGVSGETATNISEFATGFSSITSTFDQLFNTIKTHQNGFNSDLFTKMGEFIKTISEGEATMVDAAGSSYYTAQTSRMSTLAASMSSLGSGIAGFWNAISLTNTTTVDSAGNIISQSQMNYEQMKQAAEVVKLLAEGAGNLLSPWEDIGYNLGEFAQDIASSDGSASLAGSLELFFGSLRTDTIDSDLAHTTTIVNNMTALMDSLSGLLEAGKGEGINENIWSSLGQINTPDNLTSLSTALDDLIKNLPEKTIEVNIVPVYTGTDPILNGVDLENLTTLNILRDIEFPEVQHVYIDNATDLTNPISRDLGIVTSAINSGANQIADAVNVEVNVTASSESTTRTTGSTRAFWPSPNYRFGETVTED